MPESKASLRLSENPLHTLGWYTDERLDVDLSRYENLKLKVQSADGSISFIQVETLHAQSKTPALKLLIRLNTDLSWNRLADRRRTNTF